MLEWEIIIRGEGRLPTSKTHLFLLNLEEVFFVSPFLFLDIHEDLTYSIVDLSFAV